jgi:alpha-tubulin suppressor-like RCC1 family protein
MPSLTVKQLSVGYYYTCVIASDDKAYCWGYNNYGQLGNNTKTGSLIPVAVSQGAMPSLTVKQLSVGCYHTCVIASDDKAYCWGRNSNGQLGNNSTTDSSIPVAVYTSGVLNGKTIKQIFAGTFHTCTVASDDRIYCWGRNDFGQLGNNSTTESPVPVLTIYLN